MCKSDKPVPLNRKESLPTILQDLEDLFQMHVSVRASFPFIQEDLIGITVIPSKLFYELYGYTMEIHLDKPITEEMRTAFNTRAHWLNQNAIIRLYAFLNSYHFVGDKNSGIEIDLQCIGGIEVDFVRRLRNIFAHASGSYNKKKSEHRKLRSELIKYFGEPEDTIDFPLSINTVIKLLFDGCAEYIKAKYY